MMGPEVVVYTRNHAIDRVDIPMCQQGFKEIAPVYIEDDVWIGRRVIILPGVSIGKGCVLGAGSVIAKDIPPYSIVVGNPGKVIRNRLAGS
ncbi:chloramphenicol O-acetyltransferase [Pseudoalteromonas espejiana DSM 9414]|nr:chloramphenicol O-acetyltransferase [Pseudoalteromonas espejiana DSM 9414]